MTQEDFCSQKLYELLIDKGFEVDCYDAPFTQRLVTHQSAMKWLREEKGIYVYVEPYMVGGTYIEELKVHYCGRILDTNRRRLHSIENMTPYTEAIAERIEYALKSLI